MEKGLQFVNLTLEGRTKTNEYHFQRIQFKEHFVSTATEHCGNGIL